MTNKEKRQAVVDTLEYMIAEGMVERLSDGRYRLKTERELKREMEVLLNEAWESYSTSCLGSDYNFVPWILVGCS